LALGSTQPPIHWVLGDLVLLVCGPGVKLTAWRLWHLHNFKAHTHSDSFTFYLGHNTLRRHLHVMGLSNDPTCRKCGTEEETSVHILCECEALASLRHRYLGSFFLNPEDIRVLGVGAIWNFAKGMRLL
jgi:hypothetical protein